MQQKKLRQESVKTANKRRNLTPESDGRVLAPVTLLVLGVVVLSPAHSANFADRTPPGCAF